MLLFSINSLSQSNEEEMCLMDSYTTNSILMEIKYFQTLTRRTRNILTTAIRDTNIVGSG
jgi:hypothetical protein